MTPPPLHPVTRCRRIACHTLLTDQGQTLPMQVVEIASGSVCGYYRLQEELPHTEWLPGTVALQRSAVGLLHAYYDGKRLE